MRPWSRCLAALLWVSAAAGCRCAESATSSGDAAGPNDGSVALLVERVKAGPGARAHRVMRVNGGAAQTPRPPAAPLANIFELAGVWKGSPRPSAGSVEAAQAVSNLLLQAATQPAAALPTQADGPKLWPAIAEATLEAARLDSAAGWPATASWRALALIRVGLDVDLGQVAAADAAMVSPGLALLESQLGAVTGPDELRELLAGCQALDEGPEAYQAAVEGQAHRQQVEVLEALQSNAGTPLVDEVDRLGGVGRWLSRQDAELAIVARVAATGLRPAPAVMAQLEQEQRRLWGSAGSSLSLLEPRDYAHWAWPTARVRGMCVKLAVLVDRGARGALATELQALAPAVLPKPPVDLLSAGPWEYVSDGVGGRLLRSGALLLDGRLARVELGLDAPPARPKARSR